MSEIAKLINDYGNVYKNEPSYYNANGLSPMEAFKQGLLSKEEYIGFIKGNIIKYIIRAGKKGDAIGDLRKAERYIQYFKEVIE